MFEKRRKKNNNKKKNKDSPESTKTIKIPIESESLINCLIIHISIAGNPPPPPVASVDEYGHLVTGPRTGDASLLVTAHEEFGTNQTLVILIKVIPTFYHSNISFEIPGRVSHGLNPNVPTQKTLPIWGV